MVHRHNGMIPNVQIIIVICFLIRLSIYSSKGFGVDVDFHFLARLALQNNGVAKKIYENAESSAQLVGVYDQVATPLLFDIIISYLDGSVDLDSLTTTSFSNYFNGSELSIAGRLLNRNAASLTIRITAIGANESLVIEEYVPIRVSAVFKLYSYFYFMPVISALFVILGEHGHLENLTKIC